MTPADLYKQLPHVKTVLKGEEDPDGLFEQYFNEYFFVQFTKPAKPSPYSLDDLPRVRRDLRILFTSCHNQPAYKKLSDMTLKAMQDILKQKFPASETAIKCNALLTIAELNELDQNGKPKPNAQAFTLLSKLLQAKAAKDYMRAAALYGIERHAMAGTIPATNIDALSALLVQLLEQKEPPAGRDAAAHQYLRRGAAQILALIGKPGTNNSIVKAVEAAATDPSAKPTMRCEMAQFLGQFKYPKTAEAEVQRLATTVTQQSVAICKQELAAAESAGRPPSRRLILYSLDSAMRSLAGEGRGGLQSAVAGTPTQKALNGIYQKFKKVSAEIESSESPDAVLGTEIAGKLNDLAAVLNAKGAIAVNPPVPVKQP